MRTLYLLFLSTAMLSWPGCGNEAKHTPSEADRQHAAQLYQQALEQIKNYDFKGAGTTFEQVLRLDPTQYEARLGLGEIHYRQQQYDLARQALEVAVQQQPGRHEARMQLARAYLGLDRQLEARKMVKQIVADFPDQVVPRLELANLYMTESPPDPRGALAQYEAILQAKPGHPKARAGRAAANLHLGEFAASAAELDELLRQQPKDQYLTYLAGTTYYWLKEHKKAVAAYQQSIDAIPANSPMKPTRQWNLRLAYLAAYGIYPGDLTEHYQIHLYPIAEKSPVHFTDVAPATGVDKLGRNRGGAWGDYDADGDLDLFTVGIQIPHSLFRNDGGRFADIAREAGLYDPRGGWSATCADYDNDGDLDLYATRDGWEGSAPNSLYQNQGNGIFKEVSAEAGVDDPDDTFMAGWADYDNDGWVDLYTCDGMTGTDAANKLYHNEGNGRFTDQAAQAGVALKGKSLGMAFGDYDRDGDQDLYVADVANPNTLFRNEGNGRFVDITQKAEVGKPVQGGYVTFFFDADDDGDLDLFVSAMAYYEHFVESQITGRSAHSAHASLYRNDGHDTFTDVAESQGLTRSFGSMGAGWGDVDYDGRIDIYLANGGPNMARFEPNILYRNLGNRFADITESANLDRIDKGHGVAFADYDVDGDLDLYVGDGGHYPGDLWHNHLYQNDGHANNWLGVSLEGSHPSNRSAIGAQLVLRAGDLVQTVQLSSGDGFGCTNSLAAEFGLGPRKHVDQLEVQWPGGKTQQLLVSGINQTLHFKE
ncbi:MAG: tetratricopeptide repeat protein [Candidatus Latescibacteria bacterium]|nr:tetratricopeptide repeat protein [Candidatus Latescibacterota bacterium]